MLKGVKPVAEASYTPPAFRSVRCVEMHSTCLAERRNPPLNLVRDDEKQIQKGSHGKRATTASY